MKLIPSAIVVSLTMLTTCMVGEAVTSSSLKVAEAVEAHAINVFLGDVTALKLLSFVLFRAQKPLCIKVFKDRRMNLRIFSETFNKVISFVIVLKTFVD